MNTTNGGEQAPQQQLDQNALAMAFGIDPSNLDASITQNALSFLSSQLMNGQQMDALTGASPPQAKRKVQRKSGKSSPNQQQVTKPNLEALAASVFGNKAEEIKADQQPNELTAANFLSSILGNTMGSQQQKQQTPVSQNNYWNENVPLKSADEVGFCLFL
jgi:hypothetical protein